VEYGAGGLPAHYEALAIRVLGLSASRHLLDAMFDGGRPARMIRDQRYSEFAIGQRVLLSIHQGCCCIDTWVL
jgi:hypothetical protein